MSYCKGGVEWVGGWVGGGIYPTLYLTVGGLTAPQMSVLLGESLSYAYTRIRTKAPGWVGGGWVGGWEKEEEEKEGCFHLPVALEPLLMVGSSLGYPWSPFSVM